MLRKPSQGPYARFPLLRHTVARLLAVGCWGRPGCTPRVHDEAVGRCSTVCSSPAPACFLRVQGPEMGGVWSAQVLRPPLAPPPPPWLAAFRSSSSARRGCGMRRTHCNRAACCAHPRLHLYRRRGLLLLGSLRRWPLPGGRLPYVEETGFPMTVCLRRRLLPFFGGPLGARLACLAPVASPSTLSNSATDRQL